jgi:16S rRNA (cytosine1402-N4)-methyltransferase
MNQRFSFTQSSSYDTIHLVIMMSKHVSVLLDEAIDYLNIKEDGIYVDCTLGGGGHSSVILSKLTTGHLYAFDQDDYAIKKATEKLSSVGSNFTIIKSNFEHIKEELAKLDIHHVDGILYDLGVSSFQFDIPDRGFSYNYDADLDMRMDQSKELTAKTIVNEYSFEEMTKILFRYADETFAKPIVNHIIKHRKEGPIQTTFELVDIIKEALPQKKLSKKGHPAKKTFQALRIAVNDELGVFERSLEDAFTMMKTDGRIVVISFHSLEDRIAKTMFKEVSTVEVPKNVPMLHIPEADFSLLHKKVILPSKEELAINNRAHSAKLRAIKKN